MRLDAIALRNHLSHVDTRVEFNGTRLAAFVGPNGAGKSALLESLRYVLFDDARAKTDQLVRIGQTDMSATIEFDYAGATYRAIRGRTTKGAGKSYLELHVRAADGSWTPMTGDDIRSTQAAIAELLGLDADTFATVVFLGQGEADRFAEATAAERKRILGTVLGLGVYERAEARARDEARDLEVRTAAERGQVERLDDAIAELEPSADVVEAIRVELEEVTAEASAMTTRIDGAQARLTQLAGEIAKGDAAARELRRLEEERGQLAERYRREQAAIAAADRAEAAAELTLAEADAVEEATAALEGVRAEVMALEAAQAHVQALVEQERAQRETVLRIERDWEREYEPWRIAVEAARRRRDDQVAQQKAGSTVCEACGQAISGAQALRQLTVARDELRGLEAAQPKRPWTLARETAAHQRILSKIRETGAPDPAAMAEARRRLTEIERTAARAGEITAARSALAATEEARSSAQAELARIGAAGADIAERIRAAAQANAETAALLEERDRLTIELDAMKSAAEQLERVRREAHHRLANAEANVARLESFRAERDGLLDGLTSAEAELGRLRRLAVAFGVNGIPARIIESVLPELAAYANELLADLRPGVTLELRAMRAKRDGTGVVEALDLVVRDDVGERPLALFSGGERMSVSLAIAVGLSRLVARRAGSAIRSLVVDEPDGLDADARRAFGQALRVLAHHGDLERVVLVSHHPDLAEYADTVWSVSRTGAGSVVTTAA